MMLFFGTADFNAISIDLPVVAYIGILVCAFAGASFMA